MAQTNSTVRMMMMMGKKVLSRRLEKSANIPENRWEILFAFNIYVL